MNLGILPMKLHPPLPRRALVSRPRLTARLENGLDGCLTLVSAPAGFGKTTLVGEWARRCGRPVAWLTLEEGDGDPLRFLACLSAALQPVTPVAVSGCVRALQSPQPPPPEQILTDLLYELAKVGDPWVLVLDDYHTLDSRAADQTLTFLLEHPPVSMHLVIITREDPQLPLARLRGGGKLNELRAEDLRFTPEEAAAFLHRVMGLDLTSDEADALEARTEGWVVGLQLAALSLQGAAEPAGFIRSFAGSHRFVLDYLIEEVLQKQPPPIHHFLLRTSVLDRLCAPLCAALLDGEDRDAQATLEYLERANLFITPLDGERRWYRYHPLFADLLRERLRTLPDPYAAEAEQTLHGIAARWYQANGQFLDAFRHAAAARDVAFAEQLIAGEGIPRHIPGAVNLILDWMRALPSEVLDANPSLWWRFASFELVSGHTSGVEAKLNAAEAALARIPAGGESGDVAGRICVSRAVLALTRYQPDIILPQSRMALELLLPDNLTSRATANWTLGYGHLFLGDRAAARQAFDEAVTMGEKAGDPFTAILATIGLGNVLEIDTDFGPAAEAYRRVVAMAGEHPLQVVYEAELGLARIHYEWNRLDAAEAHGRRAQKLARRYERVIDRYLTCDVFLARLFLARGDVPGAAALLEQADRECRAKNFPHRIPEVAAELARVRLRQGNVPAAAELAAQHGLSQVQARVLLAQGSPGQATALLAPLRLELQQKGRPDELLRAMVLLAIAQKAAGKTDLAVQTLQDAIGRAAGGGLLRVFLDEGAPLEALLGTAFTRRFDHAHARALRVAFAIPEAEPPTPQPGPLLEPLSAREREVLLLMAQGLSNQEIGEKLFLALSTVKGHVSILFRKLQVERRTGAVARARELGLI